MHKWPNPDLMGDMCCGQRAWSSWLWVYSRHTQGLAQLVATGGLWHVQLKAMAITIVMAIIAVWLVIWMLRAYVW